MAAGVEVPECPVCLQSFDGVAAVPRVLPCGHSACEACLAALPPARPSLPDSLRCPACTLLVPFPRSHGGPRSLPKNIDLLRLCDSLLSSHPNPNPGTKPSPEPPPPLEESSFPLPWTQRLLSAWEGSVLPPDSLTLLSSESEAEIGAAAAAAATVSSHLGRPWFCRAGQRVSLLPIGAPPSSSPAETRWFRLSYMARVMESLHVLGDEARAELGFLVEASGRLRRGLCRFYGLWMDPGEERSRLYLVCERFDRGLADVLKEERKLGGEMLGGFPLVGMEMCEAVMGLHSQGVVCGCLVPSCFCFDEYRHCLLDLNRVLVAGRRIRGFSNATASRGKGGESDPPAKTEVFVSPEVFVSLLEESATKACGLEGLMGYGSDVWSLGFIFATILMGDDATLAAELTDGFCCFLTRQNLETFAKSYDAWKKNVVSKLEALLSGVQYEPLLQILISCLSYHPESRPQLSDIWRCIRGLFIKTFIDDMAALDGLVAKENPVCCLVLSNICPVPKETNSVSPRQESCSISTGIPAMGIAGSSGSNAGQLQPVGIDGDLIKDLIGEFKSVALQGHRDCVTGLAVGGGFLFSSSFDKTINVWSLQDFSQVQSLRGHEHRVMAIIVVNDARKPLCISGDSGSGIFVWSIGASLGQEPLKKWYEHSDWRFSGVHSLAVSEAGFLYSGSGDMSIKAWSLQDYSLSITMVGHKSTVSSLAVADGILYSGSWDGTIRLWWLHDHSPLSVLGDDQPGNVVPVRSLTFNSSLLVASYENGFLKMWRNDVLVSSEQIQDGAIFALHMGKNLLFAGGWDKVIHVQELSENDWQVDIRHVASINCDSVITSLIYWHGKLFVGFSNAEIKVYYFGS